MLCSESAVRLRRNTGLCGRGVRCRGAPPPPLDGRLGQPAPRRPCAWLLWLSPGSVAHSAGRVASGSPRTFIYGRRVAVPRLPVGTRLWVLSVVVCWPASLLPSSFWGDTSRQAFSAAALLTVSSRGLWGHPSSCPQPLLLNFKHGENVAF